MILHTLSRIARVYCTEVLQENYTKVRCQMDSSYQVLYSMRSDDPHSAEHIHVSAPCALVCTELSIRRENDSCTLHLTLTNPGASPQLTCGASMTLVEHNGTEHILPKAPLAFSLAAQSSYSISPLELAWDDIAHVELYLWQEADEERQDTSSQCARDDEEEPAHGDEAEPARDDEAEPALDPVCYVEADQTSETFPETSPALSADPLSSTTQVPARSEEVLSLIHI